MFPGSTNDRKTVATPAAVSDFTDDVRLKMRRLVHRIARKSGNRKIRQWSFNQEYKTGRWIFNKQNPELVTTIEACANKGSVLLLGCGTALIATLLHPDSFTYLLGIDLSPRAIALAREGCQCPRVHFEVGDIMTFAYDRQYDVICFLESIYYLTVQEQRIILGKLAKHLTSTGQFVVTIYDPVTFQSMLENIRRSFHVTKEGVMAKTSDYLMIFR
jgi:SAM-dependent methyltransferase